MINYLSMKYTALASEVFSTCGSTDYVNKSEVIVIQPYFSNLTFHWSAVKSEQILCIYGKFIFAIGVYYIWKYIKRTKETWNAHLNNFVDLSFFSSELSSWTAALKFFTSVKEVKLLFKKRFMHLICLCTTGRSSSLPCMLCWVIKDVPSKQKWVNTAIVLAYHCVI